MYKLILGVSIIAFLVLGGVFFYIFDGGREESYASNVPEGFEALGGGFLGEYDGAVVQIVRSADGYTPNDVTIRKGETISFLNVSDEFHWPASDVHPTHSIYSAFDPLAPVAPGDTWSFTFTEVGTWKFHDHIRANKGGTIRVIE